MPNFAQTIIAGHLGADPEVRYMPDGTAVANFSVAVSEKWKGKDGQEHEHTEWYRCSLFGPSAEKYVGPYLHKGDAVLVRGKMKTRKWQAQDGGDRYSTELQVDRFGGVQGLGGGKGGEKKQAPDTQAPADFDEDIPFN